MIRRFPGRRASSPSGPSSAAPTGSPPRVPPAVRVACAGAVVRDDRGRILMVRRGTEPGLGLWSLPGGRVEPGETAQQAAVREVMEETGLRIQLAGLAGVVERPGPEGVVYEIEDFFGRAVVGVDPRRIRAGDDATDARWVSAAELRELPCVDRLVETLERWRVVPRTPKPFAR